MQPQTGPGRIIFQAIVALLVALAAGFGGAAIGGDTETVTKTRTVEQADTPAEKVLDVKPNLDRTDVDQLDAGPDLNAPATMPGTGNIVPSSSPPPAVAERQADQVDAGTYDTSHVLEGAAAKPARFKCYTPNNGGTRSLSSIGLMVAHVTVSLNVAGYGDGLAICALFRNVQASATWIVDNEGNSWENVPLDRVPWTQAWYNRPACSIEYIGSTGRPGQGPAQWTDAQLREGGRLFAKCAKLAGIPIRSGAVSSSGSIITTGLITHQELGALGGGHSDPGPFWSRSRQLYWIRFYMRQPITDHDRQACRRVAAYRQRRRDHKHPTAHGTRRFNERRDRLHREGLKCVKARVKRR